MANRYRAWVACVMCVLLAFLIACPVFAVASEGWPDFGILDNPPHCQCSDFSSCTRKPFHSASQRDKQVIIVSNGADTWKNWRWDVLSTVISSGQPDKDLMCYSHMKGKSYGFITRLSNSSALVDGQQLLMISNIVKLARNHFVDYLVLDFLDILEDKENPVNTTSLAIFLQQIRYSLRQHSFGSQMLCMLPWKPGIFGTDMEILKPMMASMLQHCDGFMTNANSYLAGSDVVCKARPLVPFSKLVLGLDEFMDHGMPVGKFFMGVPWHAFDYTCESYDNKTKICKLKNSDGKHCDYDGARKQLSLGDMATKYPNRIESIRNHSWDKFALSPYLMYQADGKTHQLWFEDHHSLVLKYHLVQDMEMLGVVIWSGDDLNYEDDTWTKVYDKTMWNLLHQLMTEKRREPYISEQIRSFPARMAGVGVGCMLLGTVLGFVVGILLCARRHRRTLHPPFRKDRPQEYLDEDPGM